MTKAAIFTMKLEADLRAEFMAAASASHRPASQIVRELMRDFVRRQRQEDDHAAFLQRKVAAARLSVGEQQGRSNAEIEEAFATRRAGIADRA